jgi:hypothetical protein
LVVCTPLFLAPFAVSMRALNERALQPNLIQKRQLIPVHPAELDSEINELPDEMLLGKSVVNFRDKIERAALPTLEPKVSRRGQFLRNR